MARRKAFSSSACVSLLGCLDGAAAFLHQRRDPVELLDDATLFAEGRQVDPITPHLFGVHTLPASPVPLGGR